MSGFHFVLLLAGAAFLVLALAAVLKTCYIKVPRGLALIVSGPGGKSRVYFSGAFVCQLLCQKEFMRLPLLTLALDRRGREGLTCRDGLRADISLVFYLKVREAGQDVLRAADVLGAAQASDPARVSELFSARFAEALKICARQFDLARIIDDRRAFGQYLAEAIGTELNGYTLLGVAVDHLEQTPESDQEQAGDSFAKFVSLGALLADLAEQNPAVKGVLEAGLGKLKGLNLDPALLAQLAGTFMSKGPGRK